MTCPEKNIPPELQAMQIWAPWKLEVYEGKARMLPYFYESQDGNITYKLLSFKDAYSAYKTSGYDGIGCMLANTPYVAVVIENCRDPDTSEESSEATDVDKILQTYVEISPSGTDYQFIAKGKIPEGCIHNGSFKMFGNDNTGDFDNNFIAITGEIFEDAMPIRECQTEIDAVHKKYILEKNDIPMLEGANVLENADSDPIAQPLRSTDRTDHEQHKSAQVPKDLPPVVQLNTYAPRLVKASDVPYEPPRFLIEPYFQRGKGTLIQADNGLGKTILLCGIAAHVSTGRPLMGIPIVAPGNVLMFSVEDDLAVLRGRIEASGGDLDRCHLVDNAAGLTFNDPAIEKWIAETDARLVVFDPFQAFLGSNINMDKSNQTRPVLAKLFEMANRHDCSVAIIAHVGKGSAVNSAVNRSLGSVDIPAAMRSILQVAPDPTNDALRHAVHIKSSNAPRGQSLSYSIGDRGGILWNGFSNMTPKDLDAIDKRKDSSIPYGSDPLVKVLHQLISETPGGGFWSYGDVMSTGLKILGFPPYSSTTDLKNKLDGSLSLELRKNAGIVVTHGHSQGGQRGIRIERLLPPGDTQPILSTEEKVL